MSQNPHRLPRTVVPSKYRLTLEPNLVDFVFRGSEIIDVSVEAEVDEIVLNAAEIEVTTAELISGTESIGASARYDEEFERVTLALESPASPGEYQLKIDFTGVLNDQLRGFYRSTFTDVDGNAQTIATTQFESTDARRAFPCWDEPDFKATFQATLVFPADLMAITNTSEIGRSNLDDGRVSVDFSETMKMSTYLVAFVVGPFEATEAFDVDGVPTRIIAPRGKLHLSEFAKDCAEFCFRYLRDYYAIPYPGDKLDHIAIPDFAFGAMENVGAITYRETALLLDPATASVAEKLRVLDVIGHEIAHQWFGNLVTMGWWEGIWLNEAFASFMEMKATEAARPEWKRWLAFQAGERPWAMEVDHLSTTRPVEFEVNSPSDADQMFDALTYGKGSAVLRMIEQFIGEDEFRQGVGDYLRRHAFANTVTSDLWAGLDSASEWPVGTIMDTWILQGGYPQIDVRTDGNQIRLTQRRFLANPDDTDQTVWSAPLILRGVAGGSPFSQRVLLDTDDTTVTLDGDVEWVTANAGGYGFYRVRYEDRLFDGLIEGLDRLDALERYVLLYDSFAFAQTGQIGLSSVLELVDAFSEETEQAIWSLVFRVLGWVEHHIVGDDDRPAFQTFAGSVVRPLVDRLGRTGSDGDTDLDRRLRGQAIGVLGTVAADPEIQAWARDHAATYLASRTTGDPELLAAAVAVTANNGGPEEFRSFFDAYQSATNPQEENRFLRALAGFDDVDLGGEVIDATYDGRIRNQDGAWVQALLMANRDAGPELWAVIRNRWDEAVTAFPPMTFRRLVDGVSALSQPDVAADVHAFFAETPVPSATKALSQNLELLAANVDARQRESKSVGAWLQKFT